MTGSERALSCLTGKEVMMNEGSQLQRYREEIALGLLSSGMRSQRRMVLFPFEEGELSMTAVESAIHMADIAAAELVLLCMRPAASDSGYAGEEEHLYSNLKGLQAQLQAWGAKARIEMVAGSIAQLVREYSRQNPADLILIPGYSPGGDRQVQA
jgi:nucleotide-binding universal stress UspA family protein